jgi:competence protein ComEC
MENRQIYFQSYVGRNQFQVLKGDAGNPVISFALSFRKKLINKYNTYLPDPKAAALASTLILGYRADLTKEVIEAYSKTGTMHVLSVSGMHVGIVFLVLSFLLRPMDKNRALIVVRILCIITAIWFYSLISGFSSPVCRAALMISFVLIGKALNKSQNSYNLIGISAFFLLLYYPYYLFDAGFQLSYLAVCGLVYFHPKIYQIFFLEISLPIISGVTVRFL